MTRCPQGHFFEPQKNAQCPFCAVSAESKPQPGTLASSAVDSSPNRQTPAVTRALHQEPSGISPVVGWLVCVEGPDRGQDYRIHAGKNSIGRSRNMDIAITGDDSISRERHATIVFDPKGNAFWVQPGDASGLAYLNNELVHSPTPLKPDDVVELGRSRLVLVPFAGERHGW